MDQEIKRNQMSINGKKEIDKEVVDRYLNSKGTEEDREKMAGYFDSNEKTSALPVWCGKNHGEGGSQ